jgi:predicted ATPase/transcriptional regulator with XRE-family HTH domain
MAAASSFGELLQGYRKRARLTQQALAERANVSKRTIGDLECGVATKPHKHTTSRLAEALELSPEECTLFLQKGERKHARETREVSRFPLPRTPLVGRETECIFIKMLLLQSTTRCVTLTGPAGVGKTQLGLSVAAEIADETAYKSVFISLASVTAPQQVLSEIAQAFGIPERSDQSIKTQLLQFFHARRLLLLLDNFEQVIDAALDLTELLDSCPRLKLLVTSRTLLRISQEQVVVVPSLALPDITHLPPLDELAKIGSIALFLQCAKRMVPQFSLTAVNAVSIASICIRLDGLPLALELATPLLKLFSPQALLQRLYTYHMLELGQGVRDLPPRQQTIRNALLWSYQLLSPDEQYVFRTLSLFIGGATFEAVETVSFPETGDIGEKQRTDCERNLFSLLEKNLLVREEQHDGEIRFTMLQTVREFGRELLEAQPEQYTSVQQHYCQYFLYSVKKIAQNVKGPRQKHELLLLDLERENFRHCLQIAYQNGETLQGLAMAGTLVHYWYIRRQLTEGVHWLLLFLQHAQEEGCSKADIRYVRSLNGAGILLWRLEKYTQVENLYSEWLTQYRPQGDEKHIALALNTLGLVAKSKNEISRAKQLFEESLALFRLAEDSWNVAIVLNHLSHIAHREGNETGRRDLLEEALVIYRKIEDTWSITQILTNIAIVEMEQGNLLRAEEIHAECLQLRRSIDDKAGIAYTLKCQGDVALAQGILSRAKEMYTQSLTMYQQDAFDPEEIREVKHYLSALQEVASKVED